MWWLNLIVKVIGLRITMGTKLWMFPGRVTCGEKICPESGQHHRKGWGLGQNTKLKGNWAPAFTSLCFLTAHDLWPEASSPQGHAFPTIVYSEPKETGPSYAAFVRVTCGQGGQWLELWAFSSEIDLNFTFKCFSSIKRKDHSKLLF